MNVFVVSSPMQLLGAIEARRAYGVEDSHCELILTLRQRGRNESQIDALLDQSWTTVRRFDLTSMRSWLRSARTLRSLYGHVSLDRVFCGYSWCPFARDLCENAREIPVQLDDGTDTLYVAAFREGRLPAPHVSRLAKLARLVTGLRARTPRAIEYFTVFDIHPSGIDRVRANDFPVWRETHGGASTARTTEDWFLGSPFVEVGVCRDEAAYIERLEEIAKRLEKPVRYVPHRMEDPARVAIRAAALGTTPFSIDRPVEFEIARGPRPRALHAMISTAIPMGRAMFGQEIEFHAHLPQSDFWSSHVRDVWTIAVEGFARIPGVEIHRERVGLAAEDRAEVGHAVDEIQTSS